MLHLRYVDLKHDFFQRSEMHFDQNSAVDGVCKGKIFASILMYLLIIHSL